MPKDKSKYEVKEEPKAVEPKFRLACPACTGIALKTSNVMVGVNVACQQCGKEFVPKESDYIVL